MPAAALALAAGFTCLVAILAACAPDGARAPHPASAEKRSPEQRNAACEGCHAAEAREWRGSLHAVAHTDPPYLRAFALEPLAFCTSCHGPEAPHLALGVACITCHDQASASTGAGPGHAGRARSCESCHEFPFPESGALMQMTATEHRASPYASTPCESCHMPRRPAERGARARAVHGFAASRDPTFLRRAAIASARREGSDVVITLRRGEVGHAFPTGDIFRRLRIVADVGGAVVRCDAAAPASSVTRREVVLARKTKSGEAADDRAFVRGDEARVTLDLHSLDGAESATVRWAVCYERVGHPLDPNESNPSAAAIDGAVEIASGTLPGT